MKLNSNYIPDSVFKNLPPIFNGVFDNLGLRERDVVFLSTLTSLSSCFPRVSFKRNDGKVYYPNLNCLIIAPSASNKSYSIHGKHIVKAVINEVKSSFSSKSIENNQTDQSPDNFVDINENFMIPGNNSYAGIINCLKRNNGIGLIHESEADVIGDNLSKEWGDYSTLIRNSFEHETISSYRIKDKNTTTIENPRLSIHLTGTPDQVSKLIPSTDNGLFSRFIYYTYENELIWKNPFAPCDEPLTLQEKMIKLSNDTKFYIVNRLLSDLEFHLSEADLQKMNQFYIEIIDKLKRSKFELDTSFLLRSTTNLIRIASILSIFRLKLNEVKSAFINSTDFDTALSIIKVSLNHSIIMMKQIQSNGSNCQNLFQQIYDRLDENFSTEDARHAFILGNKSERTMYNYLAKWEKAGLIVNNKKGSYMKSSSIDKSEAA